MSEPKPAECSRWDGITARLLFWGLILLTAAIRLPGIMRPLLGNFATKNVVYGMIARNWAEGRTSLAYPMLDCLADGGRSFHMLELPVSAYLTGLMWHAFGGSLDVWGRATAIFFSAAAVGVLYLYVRRRHGQTAAVAAGLALALAPVGVIYGQCFMLEASLVFFTIATFDALDRWLAGGRRLWLAVAAASLALVVLTKVYMLVILLPLAWEVLRQRGEKTTDSEIKPVGCSRRDGCSGAALYSLQRQAVTLAALAFAIVPAALWYYHAMVAVPSGPLAARVYYSVRQSVADHVVTHALLASPHFWRHVLDNLTGVVLTPIGFALALAGLLNRRWRPYAAWLAASLLLVLFLPRKFHEMNYYWMAVLPPLCILVGLGWQWLAERLGNHGKPPTVAVVGLLLLAAVFSLRYGVRPAFVTPAEDRGVVAAGRAVEQLTQPDEPVVTMHGTTIDLLYYCNRPGWAVPPDVCDLNRVLADCRRQGARYLAIAGPEAAAPPETVASLPMVSRGDGYVVFELKTPAPR